MTTHYSFGSAGTARNRANQHTAATERHTMTDPAELLDRLDQARVDWSEGGWEAMTAALTTFPEAIPQLTSALRAVLELADELAAKCPPGEWGDGGIDTAIQADTGRAFARVVASALAGDHTNQEGATK